MGLFSKTPKPNGRIIIQGLKIDFKVESGWWEFKHRDVDFVSFDPTLTLPSIEELDGILKDLQLLKSEFESRISNGLSQWGDGCSINDGETCLINIEDYSKDKSVVVSWSGGESWGDLAVDFTISNHMITDESWGD